MVEERINNSEKTKHQTLPRWVVGLVFTALIGFLVLIGMGLRRTQEGPLVIGQKVPYFELKTFDG